MVHSGSKEGNPNTVERCCVTVLNKRLIKLSASDEMALVLVSLWLFRTGDSGSLRAGMLRGLIRKEVSQCRALSSPQGERRGSSWEGGRSEERSAEGHEEGNWVRDECNGTFETVCPGMSDTPPL